MRVGRAVLAGDAAHACNPCGGMGLTTGVIDAVKLIEVLTAVIQKKRDETVLDFYAEERRRVFTEITSPIATGYKRQRQAHAGLGTCHGGRRISAPTADRWRCAHLPPSLPASCK